MPLDGAGKDKVSHLGQTAVSKQLVLVQPGLNMTVFLTSPHAKHFQCPKAAGHPWGS